MTIKEYLNIHKIKNLTVFGDGNEVWKLDELIYNYARISVVKVIEMIKKHNEEKEKITNNISQNINNDNTFHNLIDRLIKYLEWKYPERPITKTFYEFMIKDWKGREEELKQKVLKAETEMKNVGII